MYNISFLSSGIRRKQNFEIVYEFKSDTAVLLFAFSPLLFFRFCCLIFFSLAGHLVGFILVGKVFRKAFTCRIFGFDERNGRWVVEQDLQGNYFSSQFLLHAFLLWFERSLHSAQVSRQSCP